MNDRRVSLRWAPACGALALGVSAAMAQPGLQAPAAAKAGSEVQVDVSGARSPRDFVAIVPKGSREGYYDAYKYADKSGAAKLAAPAAAGEYEIRLLGASPPYPTLARRPFTVEAASATLAASGTVPAGAKFPVRWSGPGHAGDFVTMVEAGAPERRYGAYVYVKPGTLELRAPDLAGDYEIRYLAAQSYATLAKASVKVTPASAGVRGPAESMAGETIEVRWQGPDNRGDYITVVPATAHEGASGNYAYTARGNPALVRAPLDAGEYELRYSTGQSHATLARAPLRVKPGRQEPGFVSVRADSMSSGGAVEIILDASGSMLQRMGSQRRIDVAKQTLAELTSSVIPAGTPFALRIFGREVDSCQTDLDIALAPLDKTAVAARLAALQVRNMARTPIGASLDKAAQDLAAAKGERLIILLTDGEETCGGDAAAAIERLQKPGIATRVNIVGFAIDDRKLEGTFRHWARAGNGAYFPANDAMGLSRALKEAIRPGFEVLGPQGQVVAEGVAGGEPVRVAAGEYNVRLKGQARSQPVVVTPKTTANLRF